MSCLLLLLLPSLSLGPVLRHWLPGLRVALSQLFKNGLDSLHDVRVQGLAHERLSTGRLLSQCCLRLRGTLWGLEPLVLLCLLQWRLQLSDQPACPKGRGWGLCRFLLRGALLGLELLFLGRLLLFLPPNGPGVLPRLRGLRISLSQLLKNGSDGLREVRVQGRVQKRPGPGRLFCLRCPRPGSVLWSL
jgi:hypothetical protein